MRADFAAGVIASTIANVNRKKGSKAYQPRDFMGFIPAEKTTLGLDAVVDIFKRMADKSEAKKRKASK